MSTGHAPGTSPALSALVITSDGRPVSVLPTPSETVLVTHALTLAAALATLTTDTFDCVVVEVGRPAADRAPAVADLLRSVRSRAGSAALVVAHGGSPAAAGLAEVAELCDMVVGPSTTASDWAVLLRHAVENTRLRARLVEVESAAARLVGIVDSVADAVFTVDPEGRITSWNRGAENLYGYTAAEIVGSDVGVLHPPGSDERRRLLALVEHGGQVRDHETVRRDRDGQLAEVAIDAAVHRNLAGDVVEVVVVGSDITGRRELRAELDRQTMHDVLTGLPNRSYLTYRIAQSLSESRRTGAPVAVLVADLDQFGTVDEMHGHVVGDRVLVEVAARLRTLARPVDTVARSGGDEFVLVCPGSDVAAADQVARRIIEALAEPIEVDHRTIRVSASVGIAVSPPLNGSATALLKHADVAMHEAKARGRSRSQVFDATFAHQAGEQRRMAAELREALDRDVLDVHYQPVFDLATDELVGVEALTRWQHPVHGAVSPATFVPLAETHGFVAELDRWVLDRACLDIAAALGTGDLPPGVRVAVNLSARSLDDADLIATVSDTLSRSGLPAASLVLEVTETAVLNNRDAARSSLEALRTLGVGVFLDDFGTGYSSLSFLRELPVTGVKIDRSFVRDAADRSEDLAITEAIVRLARGLGLETVGEGVETDEQRELLLGLGCASAQGFWWSPAIPLDGMPALLRAASRARRTSRRPWTVARREGAVVSPASTCCLRGGLESGQGWLVVTSDERRSAIARTLGPLHAAAVARGQLVELNAAEVLFAVTTHDGRLDLARYDQVVGRALARVGATGEGVGVHVELGHLPGTGLAPRISADLRHRLRGESDLALPDVDLTVDCAAHEHGDARLVVTDAPAS